MRQAAWAKLVLCVAPAVFQGCAPPVTMEEAKIRGSVARTHNLEFFGEPALEEHFLRARMAYRRGKEAFDRGDYVTANEHYLAAFRAQKPIDDRYFEIRGCREVRTAARAYHVLPPELKRDMRGTERAEALFADAEEMRVASDFAGATEIYARALASYEAAAMGTRTSPPQWNTGLCSWSVAGRNSRGLYWASLRASVRCLLFTMTGS